MPEQFATIRQQTGKFNLADPSEEQTLINIRIPEYGFSERFTFEAGIIDVQDMSWTDAMEYVVIQDHYYIKQKKHAEELEQILQEHGAEIEERWKEHRAEQIEDEREKLEEEKERLQ